MYKPNCHCTFSLSFLSLETDRDADKLVGGTRQLGGGYPFLSAAYCLLRWPKLPPSVVGVICSPSPSPSSTSTWGRPRSGQPEDRSYGYLCTTTGDRNQWFRTLLLILWLIIWSWSFFLCTKHVTAPDAMDDFSVRLFILGWWHKPTICLAFYSDLWVAAWLASKIPKWVIAI